MNMTLQQAMKIAADLEERGCLNEIAKAARVLLAHINSLASPQVTDDQVNPRLEAIRSAGLTQNDAIRMFNERNEFYEWPDDNMRSAHLNQFCWGFFDAIVCLLAAPPAAETYFDGVSESMNAAIEEAKPVAAWQERAKQADDWPCFSGDSAAKYMALEIAELRSLLTSASQTKEAKPVSVEKKYCSYCARPEVNGHDQDCPNEVVSQEQVPADKDAIRNAALEEAANAAFDLMFDEVGAVKARLLQNLILAFRSQPQQVTKGGDE